MQAVFRQHVLHAFAGALAPQGDNDVLARNLQRLDGPVRGNGKIIQDLEAVFRGSGWDVTKVIWGDNWDEALQLAGRRMKWLGWKI